ncbi:MAG: hypothetical protein AAFP84_14445 [Actinomycetota bacterium]
MVTPGDIDPAAADGAPVYGLERADRLLTPGRVLFLIGFALFAAFWTWALFFASKEAVNKIEDRAWAERAEAICAPVKQQIRALDLERTAELDGRAALVDRGTALLDGMLDDVMAVPPSDPKGAEIVPLWIADYEALLARRLDYANELRAGIDEPFTEPTAEGSSIPVTEKLETFAGDNEMPSCAPPRAGVLELRG